MATNFLGSKKEKRLVAIENFASIEGYEAETIVCLSSSVSVLLVP